MNCSADSDQAISDEVLLCSPLRTGGWCQVARVATLAQRASPAMAPELAPGASTTNKYQVARSKESLLLLFGVCRSPRRTGFRA